MKRIGLVLAIFITTLAANASSFFGDKTSLTLTAAEAITKGQSVSIATNGEVQVFRNGDILIGKAESAVSAGSTIKIDIPKALQGVQVTFANGGDLLEGGSATIANSSWDSKSADITVADEMRDVSLSPTGEDLIYLDVGGGTDHIISKTISQPWDISTMNRQTTNGGLLTVSGQNDNVVGMFVRPAGTDLYLVGGDDIVYQYELPTAWSTVGASYSGNSFNANGEDTGPRDVFFDDNGSHMYVLASTNDSVFEYELSTLWNASTASYSGNSFAVNGQTTNPEHISFNPNGSYMHVSSPTTVFEYSLSTPWNAATASYTGNSFVAETDTASAIDGMFINYNKDEAKMYAGVSASTDSIEQYSVVLGEYVTNQIPGVKYYTTPDGSISPISRGSNKPYGFAYSGTKLLLSE